MIEEEEFQSILSVAQRIIDVYGRRESSDAPRLSHTAGDVNIGSKHGVIDIFFRGALVFRHDPKGEITDFIQAHGLWMDELERIAKSIPASSSGIASQRQ